METEKEKAKKRIEKLKELINHHRYQYHVQDQQEISDEAFDSLKHELYKLEQQFPEFITPDSPTQRVGGRPLEEFKKVRHETSMLSLEDIFSEKELQDWENYLKTKLLRSESEGGKEREALFDFTGAQGKEDKSSFSPSAAAREFDYFVELKIDGFAVALIYEKGLLVTGATRGDGRIGEDVTQNLKTIESIPLKLELRRSISDKETEENLKNSIEKGRIEMRGEIYMERADFEKLNKGLEKAGKITYSNPRNLAAGSIRQLDPKFAASRPLKFLAYDIITDFGQKKHSEEHQILPALGFKTDPGRTCKNLAEVLIFWREVVRKREGLPYQIDGVVVNVNDNSLFEKLGVAGKSPRGARAFKFSPKQATTKVLDIKLQIGRTGAVTPVAVLDPVEVSGVTITRATLHNEGEIKKLGVKLGDTVIVERAGDVIPDVAKVLLELRTGQEKEFHFPKICPVCGTQLIKPKEEAIWRCPNKNCAARKRKNLYYFASRKAFDIDGLGPKIIDKLVDENLISQPADIFTLEEGDLVPLERFAEKSAKNLIGAIQKSKKITLSKFIFALGIRHVGEETAIDLAYHFNGINELQKATKEELEAISNVGSKMAESIYNWFNLKQNQKFIGDLLKAGVEILTPEKIDRKLAGQTFVLTGALETMTRSQVVERIRSLGGSISESVSKMTDYLIAGDNPGSKLEKAKELNVKIIGEKEFLGMIK